MDAGDGRRTDLFARLVRDRPDAAARLALASWAVGLGVGLAEWLLGGRGMVASLLSFPVFALTLLAAAALFHRDPERAGLDALKCGLLGSLPVALAMAAAALRATGRPLDGRVTLIAMAGAAVGAAVGAVAGPVVGWAVRRSLRAARGLIRRAVGR